MTIIYPEKALAFIVEKKKMRDVRIMVLRPFQVN